jgi:hypothetical protein
LGLEMARVGLPARAVVRRRGGGSLATVQQGRVVWGSRGASGGHGKPIQGLTREEVERNVGLDGEVERQS